VQRALTKERLELGDVAQASWRIVAAREQVVGSHLTARDPLLQITQRREDEVTPDRGAHHPAFWYTAGPLGWIHFELIAAVGALDGRSPFRNQGIVEVVFGTAAAAAYVHTPVTPRPSVRQKWATENLASLEA
jgi:hypothetical protein